MTTRALNVVAIQLADPQTSIHGYLEHVDDVVRAAEREQPTDLIVLPGGLTSRLRGRFEPESVHAVDGQPSQLLAHLATDLRCVVVGGFLARRGRRVVDVTVVAEPTGRITRHDSTRLTWRQLRYLAPGRSTGLGWIESMDHLPTGIASGLEWGDVDTAEDWRRTGVGLIVGGTGSSSGLGNGPFVVGSSLADHGRYGADLGGRRTARQTGVPTVLAARVGASEMTAICDGHGRVLASLHPRDGEGHVTATIAVATGRQFLEPEPSSMPRRALMLVARTGSGRGLDLPEVRSADVATVVDGRPLREVRVEACDEVAVGVRLIRLAPVDDEELPAWDPGAHIDVVLPGDLGRRQYSLCGEPDGFHYEIAVLRSEDGRGGSVHLNESVVPGDRLFISKPRNHFPLEPAPHYVFVAGGIGITPILAMIRTLVAAGNLSWHLFYGGRGDASMAFLQYLRELGPERVTTFADDRTGPIDLAQVLRATGPSSAVYCCGPEPLIAAVTQAYGDRAVRLERFARPPGDDLEPDREFTVELATSGTSLTVPPHTSLLDALLDAKVDVDYSCTNGVCGSCELRVLQGTPSHRDALYGGRPDAPDDRILACVSRARSGHLTLDL